MWCLRKVKHEERGWLQMIEDSGLLWLTRTSVLNMADFSKNWPRNRFSKQTKSIFHISIRLSIIPTFADNIGLSSIFLADFLAFK